MKFFLAASVFFLSIDNTYAQIATAGNTITGVSKFTLGDSLAKFAIHFLKPLPKPLASEGKSYQYLAALDDAIKVGRVTFKIFILDFDISGRLLAVYLNNFFQPADFAKQSRKDYKSLVAHVRAILSQRGAKKEYYPHAHTGTEWQAGDSKLRLPHKDKRSVRYNCGYSFDSLRKRQSTAVLKRWSPHMVQQYRVSEDPQCAYVPAGTRFLIRQANLTGSLFDTFK